MVRVVVTSTGKDFYRGVATAKRLHGRYEAETKTWLLPDEMPEFIGKPQNPGIKLADSPIRPQERHSNCPAEFGGVCECR